MYTFIIYIYISSELTAPQIQTKRSGQISSFSQRSSTISTQRPADLEESSRNRTSVHHPALAKHAAIPVEEAGKNPVDQLTS